jgi:hypothetical protein
MLDHDEVAPRADPLILAPLGDPMSGEAIRHRGSCYNGTMKALYKKSIMAQELPAEWREEGGFAPDDRVTVVITPADRETAGSPRRFIGAGKGVFASAREINAYIRHNRNAWDS